MKLIQRTALDSICSSYQRDLFKSMLVPIGLFVVFAYGLVYAFFQFQVSLSPIYKLALGALVFIGAQIVMFVFRRRIATLSVSHGLVCSSCGAALGFNYTTLKKTGKCGKCGEPVVEA